MEPGIFYIAKIKDLLIKAEPVADAATKSRDARQKELKAEFIKAVNKEFSKYGTVTEEYSNDFRVQMAPGVNLRIDASQLDVTSRPGKALRAIKDHSDEVKRLCAYRYSLRDDIDTSMVNKFKSRIRAVYGNKPTLEQLEQGLKDFRAIHAQHSCPI